MRRICRTVAAAAFVLAPAPGLAQRPAPSFDRLQAVLTAGEPVWAADQHPCGGTVGRVRCTACGGSGRV